MRPGPNDTVIYSPSDLVTFLKSPFAAWMERLKIARPDDATPDEESEDEKLIKRMGIEHEQRWLEGCRAKGDVAEITDGETEDKVAATLAAMRRGAGIVYQAAIGHDGFMGYADFLEKVDGESRLGPFHYEVVDTKLARSPKPYFIIQLCAYAEMLEAIQGRRPEHVHVILGTGDRKKYRTDDYSYTYRALRDRFRASMAEFDPGRRPEPDPGDDHGRWTSYVDEWVEENDHLSRVANISRSQIRKLEEAGIATVAALAGMDSRRIPKLAEGQLERLRAQARLQRASGTSGPPAFEVVPPDPADPRRGLAILPRPSAGDAWIDFEGFPLIEDGLEYLFGASTADDGVPRFQDWWAHDRAGEKKAFEGFVDFIFDRWRRNPSMHLYHYAAYEITALRKLMGRHATREAEVDALLRAEVFVDLLVVVRQGVRIGTPRYSLKHVERLYRPERSGDVATGAQSIVAYHDYRESGEPGDWRKSPKLKQIRDYNEEDCDSTRLLTEWLWARQKAEKIPWMAVPRAEVLDVEKSAKLPEEDQEAAALAAAMREEIPADPEVREREADRWKIHEILAQLLEFHRREQKPMWWALYTRRDMTHEELEEDVACLGNMRLESPTPTDIKRSKGWWYRFDPGQDTKIEAGGKPSYFSHDLDIKVSIEKIDREAGRVLLKLGPSVVAKLHGGRPPDVLSLIPDEAVNQGALKAAILDMAKNWQQSRRLPRHIEDVLLRHPARVRGHAGGPLLHPEEDGTEGSVRIAADLDRTTLCIQGPPGTGKTHTGALMILDLLRRGKRVGITATGHAAIVNLMKACCEEFGKQAKGGELSCLKAGGETEPADLLGASKNAVYEKDGSKAAALAGGFNLVGGTAWFFARPEVAASFDTLFVDEAGQFALANLVAVGRSCRSFVLLGDQLQLGQPIQGSHPGKSGKSALEYVLDDQPTIRDDFGIFLAKTYRLHPKICSFISGAIYQNRLEPKPANENRVVRVPSDGGRLVRIEAGLLFIPVEHDGNVQASDEEVVVIRDLFQELVGRERVGSSGEVSRITEDDILVVAPYNMQVRRLKAALPPRARIGSVDLFQGQQKPIVIVSMCASDGDSSPRGIEFLFNKNRLNVAVSRAQSLAIVVGNPDLTRTRCSTVEQMALVNTFCRVVEEGTGR